MDYELEATLPQQRVIFILHAALKAQCLTVEVCNPLEIFGE
jgi:hypothetical protein